MKSYLRCLEILLVWVAYCLVFNAISRTYPHVMKGFGVALDFSDLQHLVLHDKQHRDVLGRVVLFLHANRVPNRDIFSLRTHDSWDSPTYEMGNIYSENYFKKIYKHERKDAKTRVKKHWEEVQRKQECAKMLRAELHLLEIDLNEAKRDIEEAKAAYKAACDPDASYWENQNRCELSELRKCQAQYSSIKSKKWEKEEEIRNAEISPAPVIQPLPKDRKKAMRVLFFLYMPEEFGVLARLTFISQQLLSPSLDADEQSSAQLSDTWSSHYNEHQKLYNCENTNTREGKSGSVSLKMERNDCTTKQIGSKYVHNLESPSHGVWYPDQCGIKMISTDGELHTTRSMNQSNPFLIEPEVVGRIPLVIYFFIPSS